MTKAIACRLFFIFARAAPVAVIFRRGPTRWVQVIRWDTAADTFAPGQWFHGRIYERRCDLSPSGDLMVYFASNQSQKQRESDYTATWTAVSRPPWLTALALWPKDDCWAGGGMFADERTLLLNDWDDVPHPKHSPRGRLAVTVRHLMGEDAPLFDHRLRRDGWIQEDPGTWNGYRPAYRRASSPETWSRQQPGGSLRVVRRMGGRFMQRGGINRTYDETFAVCRGDSTTELPLAEVEWADWDQQGRLVLARSGQIVAASIAEGDMMNERVLADFNSAIPSQVAAPPWAQTW